ncbi:arginine--tRNA ligase [Sorangium sp. So ce367]|uniref:arginine--tRNA ligase domain-containing protein n=1 Tax=Sorangium sp. So ce367 TaxID=3133305 RepID=UPI003F5DF66E
MAAALSERLGKSLQPQFETIDRAKFGGDLALKFPELLSDGGPKVFIQKHLPWIVEVLQGPAFAATFSNVQTKGMYINVTLADRWFVDSAQVVAELGDRFATSDAQRDRTLVIDYSSPNVAKQLHAGHIRSTIIGHVLSNLHEACGAQVYRLNHVNDFGGFGFMLEGYRRFAEHFPKAMRENAILLEIYKIRRVLERVTADEAELGRLDASSQEVLRQYFPGARDVAALRAAYAEYVAASDTRFRALEAGDAGEVELWSQMVAWSLRDFDRFYDSLRIHLDLLLGESFYVQAGNQLVDESIQRGTALVYGPAEASRDTAEVEAALARGDIAEAECEAQKQAIQKDLGAVVVPLTQGQRYVVRRADGQSIYATRDLGAIRLRCELFEPTDMSYVVGQEQRVHFSRLFEAARVLSLASAERPRFRHIHFGFYVDARTGRKLSSRDTVANVMQLLDAAVAHFRAKSEDRGMTAQELELTAQQLAVGSLVFNDLKQDVTGSVDIDSQEIEATIAGFERSGGAYVVYSACRARSILRKAAVELRPIPSDASVQLEPQEYSLLLQIQQIPERVKAAADKQDPTLLVRHLLDLANAYNSYYARVPVISNGVADPLRMLFTKAVEQSLTNALRICHIECPDKI